MIKVPLSNYERAGVVGLRGHLKLFQLSVKGASGYTERFCGLGFVAVGLAQRIFDDAAFPFLDVADRLRADFLAPSGGIVLQVHGQIADCNIIAVGNHHGAFNDTFEFADVAGPRIVEK